MHTSLELILSDIRLPSKGNVRFRFYDETAFVNFRWPTVAELNAGQELEQVTQWDNFDVGFQASDTSDTVPIGAKANSVRRGAANYGGSATFGYPGVRADLTNAAALVLDALLDVHTPGYVVLSVDGEIGEPGQPASDFSFANGEYLSVLKIMTDEWTDTIVGEDPFSYTRNFVKNGGAVAYTVSGTGAPVLAMTGTGLTGAAGTMGFLSATVNGRDYTRGVRYSTSNAAIATVSSTGVVKLLATGTATITASVPGSTVTDTETVVVS